MIKKPPPSLSSGEITNRKEPPCSHIFQETKPPSSFLPITIGLSEDSLASLSLQTSVLFFPETFLINEQSPYWNSLNNISFIVWHLLLSELPEVAVSVDWVGTQSPRFQSRLFGDWQAAGLG